MKTVVVVPCYNEEKRLDLDTLRGFDPHGAPIRFLFVNDGSRDRTGELLDTLSSEAPARFETLHLPTNMGKAEAVRRGMLKALESSPAAVAFWDADLATPLDAIRSFVAIMESQPGIEIVIGSRVRLLGRTIDRRAARHYSGRIFATAASLTLGLAVYDTQCGAKLFRVTPDLPRLIDEPLIARWIFDVEMIARLIRLRRGTGCPQADAVIYEYPLERWRDQPGSRLKLRDFPIAMFDLLRIYRKYLRT